ncbi:hypothetical protein G6F48_013414 [Rhizopus delemar]|nr:hypothetical protein G6F48_013414 [Rhizopus delemar]
MLAKRTKYNRANVKKKTESRRANETNDHEEETIEYSSAIPEPESEDGMSIDEEERMSDEQQLRHLLLLFIVLFQAKHLSVKAGEDLLAFLSFFGLICDKEVKKLTI